MDNHQNILTCSRHEKILVSICSDDNCDNPLLCRSCSDNHNSSHKFCKIEDYFEKNSKCFDQLKEFKQIFNQFSGKNIEKLFIKKVLNSLHYFQRLVNKKINRTVLDLKERLHEMEDNDDNMNFIQDFLANFTKNTSLNHRVNYLNVVRSKSFKDLAGFFRNQKAIYENICLSFENFSSRFSSEFSKIVESNIPESKSLQEFKDGFILGNSINSTTPESPFKTNQVIEDFKVDLSLKDITKQSTFLCNKRECPDDLLNILEKINPNLTLKQNKSKIKEEVIESQENLRSSFEIHKSLNLSPDYPNQDKVVILLPLTIPGSGKISLLNLLLKGCRVLRYNFEVLEDTKIHRNIDNSFVFVKPLNSDTDLLNTSSSSKLKLFNSISHILNNQKKGNCLIYIDKNTYPLDIKEIVEVIKQIGCKEKLMRIVAISPDCEFPLKVNDSSYPFSLSYFIQCFLRIKAEASVEDLVVGKFDYLIQLAKCFNNFRDFSFIKRELINNKSFEYILNLPFTEEIEEKNLPYDLVNTSIDLFRTLNNLERLSKKLEEEVEELRKRRKFEEKMRSDDKNTRHTIEFLSKIFK